MIVNLVASHRVFANIEQSSSNAGGMGILNTEYSEDLPSDL